MSLLLTGADGMLAADLVPALRAAGQEVIALEERELDVTDRRAVLEAVRRHRPDIVVNCAAYTAVDRAEEEEAKALAVNGVGVEHLAEATRETGALLVHFSTDYVFDGRKGSPYVEDDPPCPLGVYGRTKLAGERALEGHPDFLLIRTAWLFGAGGASFPAAIARLAAEREELSVVADQVGCPTYAPDLSRVVDALLDQGARGVYHAASGGSCSWHEFARRIVESLRRRGAPVRCRNIKPVTTAEYGAKAPRPLYSVLSCEKLRALGGLALPPWTESIELFLDEYLKKTGR